MKVILEFRRWKLFCLLVAIPVIFQFTGLGIMISRQDPQLIVNAISMMLMFFVGVFFAWFFTLGTNLHSKHEVDEA